MLRLRSFIFQKFPTYKEKRFAHNNTRTQKTTVSGVPRKSPRKSYENETRVCGTPVSVNRYERNFIMANSNKTLVPEAKEALNQFKMEAANEVGVNLKQGYNGNLTSKEAGSIGGQMVKKMVESYENSIKGNN